MTRELSADTCEREIRELHRFFAEWYCGRCERAAFERLERALGESFERVAPDASVAGRSAVLGGLRDSYDHHERFEIEIRNVEPVRFTAERALVRYEEWQTTPSGSNGRLSSVLFGPGNSGGEETAPAATWLYLHESWLQAPDTA